MAMTLITTNTSSGAATSDFTSSIDSTYKLYIFKFIDINPATDSTNLTFQANVVDASGYNETITSTIFATNHHEDDDPAEIGYDASLDQAQGTAFQPIITTMGNGSDESGAGELYLLNPSNTTYVKHFYATANSQRPSGSPGSYGSYVAGYFNVTGAIDDIQFKMSSGNFDGTIKMYGVG